MSFPGSILLSDDEARRQTSTQRLPLGTRGVTQDGRVFRYCKNAATDIAVGKLVGKMANDISLDLNQDLATSTLYQDELSTDATVIVLKPAATEVIAADTFKDGYLFVNDLTGEGQYMMVEGNAYVDGTISALMPIYLQPGSRLSATLNTTSLMGVIENKYQDVVISGPDASHLAPLGVTVRAVTASYYFWLQTWGPCMVWLNLAVVDGDVITYDTFTASGTAATVGAAHVIGTSTDAITGGKLMPIGRVIGHAICVCDTTDHGLINLEIEP